MDLRSNIGTAFKVIFLGTLLYFCVVFFIPKWESLQLSQRLETVSAPWLVTAGLLAMAQYLLGFGLWLALVRLLGSRPAVALAFRAFALSLLPKYIPGKVISHGVRARLALQAGIPAPTISSSFIWEAVIALGSASLISLLSVFYHSTAAPSAASGWLVVAFIAGALVFAGVGSGRGLSSRWKEWANFPRLVKQPQALAALFGFYMIGWVVFGIGHWCLANALTSLPATTIVPLIIAVAVSWGLGFISIIAPGGIGVREGALYLFALNWMGEAEAILFVTLSRLLMFAVEILFTAFWGLRILATLRKGGQAISS